MKTVLITGCSSGVGKEAAILFARKGFRVIATMRTVAKGQPLVDLAQAEKLDLLVRQLDVCDPASVESCVKDVINDFGGIDVLINNAGCGFAKPSEFASEEEMKWVTDVNYHGIVRCTKAVLPHMRKAKSGRIVNVTSVGGLVGQPFNELYCAAKFAVEGYTEGMAAYVTEAFGVKFSCVEPGGISTEFLTSAAAKSLGNDGMPAAYAPLFEQYMSKAPSDVKDMYQTPLEVAQVLLNVSQQDSPPLRVRTSNWAEKACELKTKEDPDGTKLLDKVKSVFL